MKFITSQEIIARTYRNLNLEEDIRFNDAIEWIHEVLEFIGTFEQFENKITELTVVDFKAELPCDLHQLHLVTCEGYGVEERKGEPYYTYSEVKEENVPVQNQVLTYDVRYPYLYTNLESGILILDYLALQLDESGFPMVPDLEAVKQACFWYIVKMIHLGGWAMPQGYTLQYIDAQVKHYIGAAKVALRKPSGARIEKMRNIITQRIPKYNQYQKGFRHLGTEESIVLDGRTRINSSNRIKKWRI